MPRDIRKENQRKPLLKDALSGHWVDRIALRSTLPQRSTTQIQLAFSSPNPCSWGGNLADWLCSVQTSAANRLVLWVVTGDC